MAQENDGFAFDRSLSQRFLAAIYRVINLVVPWHRLPTLIGGFNLEVIRERNLHHAGYGLCAATPWSVGNDRWRSPDGSYNSLEHPRMGMAGVRFGRNVPLAEAIRVHSARHWKVSPMPLLPGIAPKGCPVTARISTSGLGEVRLRRESDRAECKSTTRDFAPRYHVQATDGWDAE
jgi:hypothetical protein